MEHPVAETLNIKPVQTLDGSWTCFNATVGEHYHNIHGAAAEARAIYVSPIDFDAFFRKTDPLVILDPFFGMGYNTWAVISQVAGYRRAKNSGHQLAMLAFEFDPEILPYAPQSVPAEELGDLKQILEAFEHNIYYQTQTSPQDAGPILEAFLAPAPDPVRLKLLVGDLRQLIFTVPDASVDIVFHDAFSTGKQPELWTEQLFAQYRRILKPETGTVLTYSASARIRTAFVNAGFQVGLNQAETHKVGTRATLAPDVTTLLPLSELDTALMACKAGLPYHDLPDLSRSPADIQAEWDARSAASPLPGSSESTAPWAHAAANASATPAPTPESPDLGTAFRAKSATLRLWNGYSSLRITSTRRSPARLLSSTTSALGIVTSADRAARASTSSMAKSPSITWKPSIG